MPAVLGGAALHLFISPAALRIPVQLRHWVTCGLLHGLMVCLMMSYVVIPLSVVAFKPVTAWPMMATSMTVPLFLFGLPISLYARCMLSRN